MNSNENDTLLLPDLPLVDGIGDEDFIPTSQPQSFPACVISQMDTPNSYEEGKDSGLMSNSELLLSVIDDTIPNDSALDPSTDRDKSSDFIPETETKKRKIDYSDNEPTCKKKLPVEDDYVKCTEDMFGSEVGSNWNAEVSKIPESPVPATENASVIMETPIIADEKGRKNQISEDALGNVSVTCTSVEETRQLTDESVTEIIVNDSADTVELDTSENVSLIPLNPDEYVAKTCEAKIDISCSSPEVARCEKEERSLEYSSGILPDTNDCFPLSHVESEKFFNETDSQKLYQKETVEDKESILKVQEENDSTSSSTLPIAPESVSVLEEEPELQKHPNETLKQEPSTDETNQTAAQKNTTEKYTPDSLESKTMKFNLVVDCLVTINTKTKKVHQKSILNVSELRKPKPKTINPEHHSDIASEKSMRYSTSSSGSVYSDKTGLPFALPKRLSTISDQTDASDSSEEVIFKKAIEAKKAFERLPWSNEYLLPMKMDELMTIYIENPDFLLKPPNKPFTSPKKSKKLKVNGIRHSSKDINEETNELNKVGKDIKSMSESKTFMERTNGSTSNVKHSKGMAGVEESEKNVSPNGDQNDQDDAAIKFCDGLAVFARWADKRYYPGVLSGNPKNDRWEVKFDDGTIKAIREDFLLPCKWLKVGELVFTLVDDKYVSGQITNIIQRNKYTVELDDEKKHVTVQISDLCLTEVMAGIVREKYKPLSETPRGKGLSHIDFDNVLVGKRVREQRTPLRANVTVEPTTSSSKKKSSIKSKKDEAENKTTTEKSTPKGTPQKKISLGRGSNKKTPGLQTENGHLVEDKVISGDSPSTEAGETSLRASEESSNKVKPRSLSYDMLEGRSGRKTKASKWLTSDGTPIPSCSGVKVHSEKAKKKKSQAKQNLKNVEGNVRTKENINRETLEKKNSVEPSSERVKGKRKLKMERTEEIVEKRSALKMEETKKKTKTHKK